MRICYYPAYAYESASSRLRVYWIAEKLREWGHEVWFQSSPFEADIIVIQKCTNTNLLEMVREAKKRKIPVLFDYCDPGPWKEMIELADRVTSDSQELLNSGKKLVKKPFKGKVIGNPIDYIKEPLPKRTHTKDKDLEIVYFAFPANLIAFRNCRPALERLRKEGYRFNFTYISGEQNEALFRNFKHEWKEWNLNNFSKDLQEFDLAVIPQAWNWKGPCKQEQAISHNLPAVCEDILPNRELYEKAGLTEYLASTDEEWYQAIKKLFDPKERNSFLEKGIWAVWESRSLDRITKEWLELMEELIK